MTKTKIVLSENEFEFLRSLPLEDGQRCILLRGMYDDRKICRLHGRGAIRMPWRWDIRQQHRSMNMVCPSMKMTSQCSIHWSRRRSLNTIIGLRITVGLGESLASMLTNKDNYMKKIELIPYIYAGDFPRGVEDEFKEADISTHYQNDVIGIDWKDEDSFPIFKTWLLFTYGNDIKAYDSFAMGST